MKLFKNAWLHTFVVGLLALFTMTAQPLHAVPGGGQGRDHDDTDETLRDFIRSKRKIPLAKKANLLKISGEVHTEWAYQRESFNGKIFRNFQFQQAEVGPGGGVFAGDDPILVPYHFPKIKFDLFVDWDYQKMYVRTDVRFAGDMGVDNTRWRGTGKNPIDATGWHGSGTSGINLRQAYVGYDVFKDEKQRFFIELGRRGNLYKVFESEIAFDSRLDGLYIEYNNKGTRLGREVYGQWAGFVVDTLGHQYAWGAEVGIEGILCSRFDASYTFFDWRTHSQNRFFVKDPQGFRFKVSQWRLNWFHEGPFQKCVPLQLFGAFLMNHSPSKVTTIDAEPADAANYVALKKKIGRRNTGAYIGFQYGEPVHEGDWYVKGVAAYLEAQCIPDEDVRNIATGNYAQESFTAFGRGWVNWKGYYVKLGYVFTENFVVELGCDRSWSLDNSINGTHRYTRVCVETTYSF